MALSRSALPVSWALGAGLTAMGGLAFVAALLPFLPGDATWEILVLGPVAQSTLLTVTGLYLLAVSAVTAGSIRALAAVLVTTAMLLSLLAVAVVTVALDLWLLASPTRFGQAAVGDLETLGVRGALLGVIAAAATAAGSAHFATAFHTLRGRR